MKVFTDIMDYDAIIYLWNGYVLFVQKIATIIYFEFHVSFYTCKCGGLSNTIRQILDVCVQNGILHL